MARCSLVGVEACSGVLRGPAQADSGRHDGAGESRGPNTVGRPRSHRIPMRVTFGACLLFAAWTPAVSRSRAIASRSCMPEKRSANSAGRARHPVAGLTRPTMRERQFRMCPEPAADSASSLASIASATVPTSLRVPACVLLRGFDDAFCEVPHRHFTATCCGSLVDGVLRDPLGDALDALPELADQARVAATSSTLKSPAASMSPMVMRPVRASAR